MRQQTMSVPGEDPSDSVTASRGTGMDVMLQLVVAALVLAVAIWFCALPN